LGVCPRLAPPSDRRFVTFVPPNPNPQNKKRQKSWREFRANSAYGIEASQRQRFGVLPMTERTLFLAVLDIDDPSERNAYLERACAHDPELRSQVDQLLKAHLDPGDFMEQPAAVSVGATSQAVIERLGSTIGPYKLKEQIGEGGMGLVFVAEQHEPVRRKVALKLIKPGMDSRQVIARFEAERQALALMNHANIAKVFDGGETPSGRPYFVMELVKGVPITEYCDQNRLTPRARLELFGQVCAAVQHAHQKGIIHRDIKPSNVIVSSHDGTPVVKVIDFGVAKAIGQQLTDKSVYTHFSQFIGTPLYMSPEQAGQSDLDVDTRTDIYALGVLLYELLSGTTPFDKERLQEASYDEIRRLIREEEPPKPSKRMSTLNQQAGSTISAQRQSSPQQLCVLLRGELDWIVMKALEKDRNHRYESASAFAADVERYLKDEPVQACPPSLRYRFGKFVRKHRRSLLSAAAAAVAAILLAVVVGFSLADRANRLTKTEQQARESLAGARTAIEAGDLTLAEKRVAEALAVLGTDRAGLHAFATDVDRLEREIKDRQSDEARFRQFVQLASDAQDEMSRFARSIGEKTAQDALDLYGVLDDDRWLTRLDNSSLTPDQKKELRETAYFTLVSLADRCVRMPDLNRIARALPLLTRAEAFHAPTRAFYFVRSQYHLLIEDKVAARQDHERFQATAAISPWDHILPGRTADAKGSPHEAIRAYQAALDLQPDHYNSLYFLGLSSASLGRHAEAIAYYRACEVLRPNDESPFLNRLGCYVKSGRLEELEAQESALLPKYLSSPARDSNSTLKRLRYLMEHFERAGKFEGIDRLAPQLIQHQRNAKASDAQGLADSLAHYGRMLLTQGRYRDAEPLLRECLTIRTEHASESWLRFNAQSMLGDALLGHGKFKEAEPHVLEGYRGAKARISTIPIAIRRIREREVEDRLLRLYDRWGKKEEAENWRAELKDSYIHSWLILSESLPYDRKDHGKVLDRQQIAGEGRIRPRAGDPVQVGDLSLVWKEHHSADKYLDLKDAYSTENSRIAYMVCYIHADDNLNALLSVAQDDQAKVYLNDQEVFPALEYRGLSLETTPISLKKGSNALVFKVINGGGAWGGIVRVWRTDGLPTKGIEFRLTP
jgi:serine/threonine protein kinase/tetratricopeptide (TPR) repeat protein